jgi:ATP adenylyltransferase
MAIEVPVRDPCPYCENFAGRFSETAGEPPVVFEDDEVMSYLAPAPLGGMAGHVLVVPKRHVETIFDLTFEEEALLAHVASTTARVVRDVLDPDGLVVLQRNGLAAEQSVPHVHVHVIPRRDGTVFPPTEWVDTMPHAERMDLARLLRSTWPGAPSGTRPGGGAGSPPPPPAGSCG